jgi:hypothetical protein
MGLTLGEVEDGLGGVPDGIVQRAVKARRLLHADGTASFARDGLNSAGANTRPDGRSATQQEAACINSRETSQRFPLQLSLFF